MQLSALLHSAAIWGRQGGGTNRARQGAPGLTFFDQFCPCDSLIPGLLQDSSTVVSGALTFGKAQDFLSTSLPRLKLRPEVQPRITLTE